MVNHPDLNHLVTIECITTIVRVSLDAFDSIQ